MFQVRVPAQEGARDVGAAQRALLAERQRAPRGASGQENGWNGGLLGEASFPQHWIRLSQNRWVGSSAGLVSGFWGLSLGGPQGD